MSQSQIDSTLSISQAQRNRYLREIENSTNALKNIDDPLQRSNRLMYIGMHKFWLADTAGSQAAYENARRYRVSAGASHLVLESTSAIASILATQGKYEEAIKLVEGDVKRFGLPDNPTAFASLHELLAMMYTDSGQFDEGARNARIAAEAYSRLHRRDDEADIIYYEARARYGLGQKEQAAALLRESYEYFKQRADAYGNDEYRQKAQNRRQTAKRWGITLGM